MDHACDVERYKFDVLFPSISIQFIVKRKKENANEGDE